MMQYEVHLVHAEPGCRVVEARAMRSGELLGSALGEAADAMEAEDRALDRLRRRLGDNGQDAQGPLTPPLPAAISRGAPTAAPRQERPAPRPRQGPGGGSPGERVDQAGQEPAGAREPGAGTAAAGAAGADTGTGEAPEPQAEAPASGALTGAAQSPAKPPEEAEADPPEDPDDWSAELARLDLSLRRIGWGREQEGEYLRRAFGHPSRSRITAYGDLQSYLRMLDTLESGADPLLAPVPLRRRELIAQSEILLQRLGWDGQRSRGFSAAHLGGRSRQQLNDEELLRCNLLLEAQLLAAAAPEPAAQVAATGAVGVGAPGDRAQGHEASPEGSGDSEATSPF